MWIYETDENPKRKHHWAKNEPGVEYVGRTKVSKCPADLSHDEAAQLLNRGYPYYPPGRNDHPSRIYAVRQGVVYRATPTVPGKSYHGFPEIRENLPPGRQLREEILKLAREEGTEDAVRKWLK